MIQLHQTLHGYSGGHRLLASSVELDAASRKDMGVLSDLSGTVMAKGYETYLTAYPLPSAELYVFARTWYAAEMERPGSVWTHSLLVRYSDVAKLEHPGSLTPLFVRPAGATPDLSGYEAMLTAATAGSAPPAGEHERDLLAQLVVALYGQPGPVYLLSPDAQRFEGLLLDLWAQQWPRLRRTFTFCSGALEPRSIRRRTLDLQVVPRTRTRTDGATVAADAPGEVPAGDWPLLAVRDLRARRPTPLRAFLRRYGVDVADMRLGFRGLVATYALIGRRADLTELVAEVGRSFPDPDDACRLKEVLFQRAAAASHETDQVIITALARSPHASAFTDAQTEVWTRLERLAREDLPRLVSTIVEIGHPPATAYGEQIIKAAIAELAPAGAVDLLRAEPLWAPELLRLRPAIAAADEFWSLPDAVRRDALHLLASVLGREAELWRPIASAVARQDEHAAEQVLEVAGSVAVDGLLDALDTPGAAAGLPKWVAALAERTPDVISWLGRHADPGRRARSVLVHLLDPEADAVLGLGIRPWLGIGAEAVSLRSGDEGQRQLAFALALALRSGDPSAERLAADTFPHVHALAAGNQLGDGSWATLARHRPLHGDPPPWDRCEWLRRRLVDAATSFGWQPGTVASALSDEGARARAAEYADRFAGGRPLAAALRATLPPPPPPRAPEPKQSPARKPPKKAPGKKSGKKPGKPKRRWHPF